MVEHINPNADAASETSTGVDANALNSAAKVNLLGMPEAKLIDFFETLGEPKFRAVQVMKWIHQFGADNFDDMTNVSKDLRAKLKDIAEFYKVNEADLKAWNNLSDSSVVKAGERLIIKLKKEKVGN